MAISLEIHNTQRQPGKLSPVTLRPVDQLRIMGSGNSGMDPVFDGSGPKNTSSRLQYYLNALTGKKAAYLYNSSGVGSNWTQRWDYPYVDNESGVDGWGPRARWFPQTANTLLITNISGSWNTGQFPLVRNREKFAQWARLYWTSGNSGAGADVVIWVPQCPRGFVSGSPAAISQVADWGAWPNSLLRFYEEAALYSNAFKPSEMNPVRIIPLALVMDKIRLATIAGIAPTSSFYDDLFAEPGPIAVGADTDPFHFGDNVPLGLYTSSATAAVGLTGASPHLLPDIDDKGVAFDPAHTHFIKQCIYDALRDYWMLGLDTSGWVRA